MGFGNLAKVSTQNRRRVSHRGFNHPVRTAPEFQRQLCSERHAVEQIGGIKFLTPEEVNISVLSLGRNSGIRTCCVVRPYHRSEKLGEHTPHATSGQALDRSDVDGEHSAIRSLDSRELLRAERSAC